jgi:zeaxanthin glucosyltransferase
MEDSLKLTIAFAMLSETGHYTGTFRLARSLRDRGHRIVYIGIADFEKLVTSQGFEFAPFAADLLPAGYLEEFRASQSEPNNGMLGKLKKRRSDERFFAAYLNRIKDGPLDECLVSRKPDLLLCDTFMWYIALRALKLGIRTVDISIILSLYQNLRIPPIVSSIFPGDARCSAFKVRASWKRLRLKFFFTKRLASGLLGWYRFPTRMHHLVDVFLQIAKHSDYPCKENKTYWFGEMGPRLVLPEIVLCPEAFQLPGVPAHNRRYLSDFVDIERREEPLDSDGLGSEKPLVYCSLGTAAHFYPHSLRFFEAVVEAARMRGDWRFVLHVGDHPKAEKLGPAGPNLPVRKRVPQLNLLKKASVMVTHGGLNSIMECIHFGVPMVIFPGLRDQPGNAVRAAHHNIALVADMARVTPKMLVDLAGRAMSDDTLLKGLADMKTRIAAEPGMDAIVAFIESYPE